MCSSDLKAVLVEMPRCQHFRHRRIALRQRAGGTSARVVGKRLAQAPGIQPVRDRMHGNCGAFHLLQAFGQVLNEDLLDIRRTLVTHADSIGVRGLRRCGDKGFEVRSIGSTHGHRLNMSMILRHLSSAQVCVDFGAMTATMLVTRVCVVGPPEVGIYRPLEAVPKDVCDRAARRSRAVVPRVRPATSTRVIRMALDG